jgi:hypothetical protein
MAAITRTHQKSNKSNGIEARRRDKEGEVGVTRSEDMRWVVRGAGRRSLLEGRSRKRCISREREREQDDL